MIRIIIDGYNLIRRVPDLSSLEKNQGLEASREELENCLAGYAASRQGVRVLVVYDSSYPVNLLPGSVSRAGIETCFPGNADKFVVEQSRKFAELGEQVRVVSSDVAGVCQPLKGTPGIEVLSAERFWATCLYRRRKHRGDTGSSGESRHSGDRGQAEKPRQVTPKEVNYWLDIFRPEDGKSESRTEAQEAVPAEKEQAIPAPEDQGKEKSGRSKEIRKKRYLRRQKRGKKAP